jgi:hypothetical protein
MTRSTGLSRGENLHVMYKLGEAILKAHWDGRVVEIEGLGTFAPVIRRDGSLDILFRPRVEMLGPLNALAKFPAKSRTKLTSANRRMS